MRLWLAHAYLYTTETPSEAKQQLERAVFQPPEKCLEKGSVIRLERVEQVSRRRILCREEVCAS